MNIQTSETEARTFFMASTELHTAIANSDGTLADLALGEIMGIWLHSDSLKLRARCEALLERHGWAGEMAAACSA